MSRVRAQVRIDGDLPIWRAEELWYELTRWPVFVDGFAHAVTVGDGWPRSGTLVWDSHPGGRGRVAERVTRFVAGAGQEVEVEDAKLTGTQRLSFGPGVVALELDYRLKDGAWLLDLLFVRRAMRDSLQRTLNRFAIELRAERELSG